MAFRLPERKERFIMPKSLTPRHTYSDLLVVIGDILQQGKNHIVQNINNTMVQTYWAIGKQIVE